MRRSVGLLLATALLAAAPARTAAAPAPPAPPTEAAVVGSWRCHRPAGADLELDLTLHLLADGTAELYSGVGGGAAFLEKGTWRIKGSTVTVLVFEIGRPPSPNEMLLEVRGDALLPLRWDAEFYGKSPLGSFLRQPGGEPPR